MKRVHILWLILILSFILFLIFIFFPKNYTQEYKINEVKIKESYNKKDGIYYFTFIYKDITLDYLIESKYIHKRTFINNIEIKKDEEGNFCLIPKGEELKFIPLCYQDKEIIHYSLINETLKKELSKDLFKDSKLIGNFQDIEIYNIDYTYLIWHYDGFYYIKNNEKKKIDLFEKELYSINLVGYTKDYLVIADYDSNYTFNNLYTLNIKNGNLKKYGLDRNIYFDSYYIGYVKNKLYIIDNKESLMYEFNAKNGDIDKIESKVYKKGKWERASIKTLINKKQEFDYNSNYKYELKDNNLYMNYSNKNNKVLISRNVKDVVRIKDKDIFYIKDDILYHFNNNLGEEKLLSYYEWNFNYENIIYIN